MACRLDQHDVSVYAQAACHGKRRCIVWEAPNTTLAAACPPHTLSLPHLPRPKAGAPIVLSPLFLPPKQCLGEWRWVAVQILIFPLSVKNATHGGGLLCLDFLQPHPTNSAVIAVAVHVTLTAHLQTEHALQ